MGLDDAYRTLGLVPLSEWEEGIHIPDHAPDGRYSGRRTGITTQIIVECVLTLVEFEELSRFEDFFIVSEGPTSIRYQEWVDRTTCRFYRKLGGRHFDRFGDPSRLTSTSGKYGFRGRPFATTYKNPLMSHIFGNWRYIKRFKAVDSTSSGLYRAVLEGFEDPVCAYDRTGKMLFVLGGSEARNFCSRAPWPIEGLESLERVVTMW